MKRIALLLITLTLFISCKDEIGLDNPEGGADLVVVGNIYTSDPQNYNVRAFVVNEGRYVYVGNEADAMQFIKEGKTQVVKSDAAMIMPGCTDSFQGLVFNPYPLTLLATPGSPLIRLA